MVPRGGGKGCAAAGAVEALALLCECTILAEISMPTSKGLNVNRGKDEKQAALSRIVCGSFIFIRF